MHPHCLSHFTSLTCTTINTHKPHHSHAPPSPLTLHITHMHLHCLSHFTSLTCTTIPSHTSYLSHAPPSTPTLSCCHGRWEELLQCCSCKHLCTACSALATELHTHTHTHTYSQPAAQSQTSIDCLLRLYRTRQWSALTRST